MDILVLVEENHHIMILNGFQYVPLYFLKESTYWDEVTPKS